MKIHIRERDAGLTEIQRTQAERQVGLALGRFGERIGRVVLRFSDMVRERGRPHKRCQIDVGLQPRRVRVEETDADVLVALDRAAGRASRSVARALERERDLDERPVRSESRRIQTHR